MPRQNQIRRQIEEFTKSESAVKSNNLQELQMIAKEFGPLELGIQHKSDI